MRQQTNHRAGSGIYPRLWLLVAFGVGLLSGHSADTAEAAEAGRQQFARFPDILLITVDTLRADRLSGYGYGKPTSPRIDQLMAEGVRFTKARTVEPLTSPALCSLLTSRWPHEHGSTRNGLSIRPGLDSLALVLAKRGYKTAAFVGNWTLRDPLSGLGEHFQRYEEVFSRKRWLGLFNSEATGEDLTAAAFDWIEEHHDEHRPWPYFAWVHYVEPHAPYRAQRPFTERLGYDIRRGLTPAERYDTEVAFIDDQIGQLLDGIRERVGSLDNTLVILAADHGESLGEHRYWGHGRRLNEPSLHVPLSFTWPRKIIPGIEDSTALLIDVAPTVLSLAGLASPREFRGMNLSPALLGGPSIAPRTIYFQAHKGAVMSVQESDQARLKGLLKVGLIEGSRKEILEIKSGKRWIFDLSKDPDETKNLAQPGSRPSETLEIWLHTVVAGLEAAGDLAPAAVDAETMERLKALGYID